MEAVGLDGRVLRVKGKGPLAEARLALMALGVSDKSIRLVLRSIADQVDMRSTNINPDDPYSDQVDMREYWEAWDKLPPEIRHWVSENAPGDENAVGILRVWEQAKAAGATLNTFLPFMERTFVKYLNTTAHLWPTPPPAITRLPTWEKHNAS